MPYHPVGNDPHTVVLPTVWKKPSRAGAATLRVSQKRRNNDAKETHGIRTKKR